MTRTAAIVALFVLLVSACRSAPSGRSSKDEYVFVWLKTGPGSAHHTDAEKKTIIAGHMSNMRRLAAEKMLIVAGPFGENAHDADDRGIFVFDVPTLEKARELVATDPGVQSGEFRAELWPMRSSPTLRRNLDLEKQRLNGRAWTMDDGRVYQLVTVKDVHSAQAAIADLEKRNKVVWSGRFGGAGEGWGVVVLDAQSPQEALEVLGPDRHAMGELWIDPWFSSKSLEGLPALRAQG